MTHPGHHACTSLLVYCTSFQIGRGSDVLKVVHVDDIDDRRHHPGLVLRGEGRHEMCEQKGEKKVVKPSGGVDTPPSIEVICMICLCSIFSSSLWLRSSGSPTPDRTSSTTGMTETSSRVPREFVYFGPRTFGSGTSSVPPTRFAF